MKTVLLLRHAKSSWDSAAQNDHDRPLNRRGERAADILADHLAAKGPRPDLILCSTAMRTRQTLAPLVKALGLPAPPISLEKELYLASEDALLERLQALAEVVQTVLLIGHNDGIGQLAGTLAGTGREPALGQLREKYPTGALATLRFANGLWSALAPGACELLAFVRPRDLDRS
ncbi:histidine phosphatase family protein [Reyranella sp.]|uniref:SixA phosphatase family protein n=1 Tax=Reyranella sp. TaxID=1929291 RepID=UPI001219C4BB|nr:histidine phosphatase family protein [Reyranella sp.]TAJ89353.1 MAG: histidine phosphatase family protein [Reyranella sp.]